MQNIGKIVRFLSRLFLEMQSLWRDRPQTRLELKYCLCFFDRFSWILLGRGPAAEVRVCHPDVGEPVHTLRSVDVSNPSGPSGWHWRLGGNIARAILLFLF